MHNISIGDQVGSLDPEDSSDDHGIVEAVSPDGTCAKVKWNNGNTHWAQVSMLSPYDEADNLDFAMLTPPTRPGPCKAATVPEMDPVERRLERERKEAEHIIAAVEAKTQRGPDAVINGHVFDYKYTRAVEVRHGSGKVKV